jgi:hypothetical protein
VRVVSADGDTGIAAALIGDCGNGGRDADATAFERNPAVVIASESSTTTDATRS